MITSKDVARIDSACSMLGISTLQLMEAAGKSVADEVYARRKPPAKVFIACGPGGNGGDGLVAARYLYAKGYQVVVAIMDPHRIRRDDVKANLQAVKLIPGIKLLRVDREEKLQQALQEAKTADVVIDALFGVGFRGKLPSTYAALVEAMNSNAKALHVAVDVPTGLDADTGEASEPCFKADVTVTFIDTKPGLKREFCGEVVVADIGVPWEARAATSPAEARELLTPRSPSSWKGVHGKVLVIGGSKYYTGAPALAAMAALAIGADIAVVYSPSSVANTIRGYDPSIIAYPSTRCSEILSPECIDEIKKLSERFHVILVGPGLSREPEALELARTLVEELDKPLVIDADALRALEGLRLNQGPGKAILTPNRAEFQVVAGVKLPEDLREACDAVKKAAREVNATILAKAPVDVISDGSNVRLNFTGNPLMTVGGTGDVVSGAAAALLARSGNAFRAAAVAAFIVGLAGDLAAREHATLTPRVLVDYVPRAVSVVARQAEPSPYSQLITE